MLPRAGVESPRRTPVVTTHTSPAPATTGGLRQLLRAGGRDSTGLRSRVTVVGGEPGMHAWHVCAAGVWQCVGREWKQRSGRTW